MLEPVHVGGVTIKLATLHNEEDLARKDIREGEEVIVLRAGDVIPQVLSPAPHVAEREDRPPRARARPQRCPVCDTPTVKPEGSVFTRCPNRDCPGRRWQLLKHFVGAMDIDGLGEKQVSLFMELGWVRTAADFYRLSAEQIAEQTGFGEVSAGKLVAAIEPSKQPAVRAVLFALGIEEVGYVTGRNLAQQFRTIDALLDADARGDRADAGGRPEDGARRSTSSSHDPHDAGADRGPARQGLRFEEEGPPPGEGPLAGKTLVLTGTLPELTREQATEMIIARRREGDRLGVAQDRLPGRRRERRVEARPGRAAGRCRCSTRTGLRELLRRSAAGAVSRCSGRARPPSGPGSGAA